MESDQRFGGLDQVRSWAVKTQCLGASDPSTVNRDCAVPDDAAVAGLPATTLPQHPDTLRISLGGILPTVQQFLVTEQFD